MTLVGRILLALAALGALSAAVLALVGIASGGPAGVADWWRALGLPVFAGLFALLAVQPQRGLTLWLLLIANKAALAIVGATLGEAGLDLLVVDGILAVLLVAALLLTRGWRTAAPRATA